MDLLAVILFIWALWLSKRTGAPRWLRFMPPALVVNFIGSLAGTLLGLMHTFRSLGGVDAGHKQHSLSEGIQRAMSYTSWGSSSTRSS